MAVITSPELTVRRGTPTRETIGVFLVEDDGYFRQGLRALLAEHAPAIRVVGDSTDTADALARVADLGPDVVLTDVDLPDASGPEAIRRLAAIDPALRVVVLSGSASGEDVVEAILAGAHGYLLKSAPIDELVDGIRAAARGGSALSPAVAALLLDHVRAIGPANGRAPSGAASLTRRELDVLRLLAEGLENAQIADRLVISPRTARSHVASILAKLGVENRIQAAVHAVRHGLA